MNPLGFESAADAGSPRVIDNNEMDLVGGGSFDNMVCGLVVGFEVCVPVGALVGGAIGYFLD